MSKDELDNLDSMALDEKLGEEEKERVDMGIEGDSEKEKKTANMGLDDIAPDFSELQDRIDKLYPASQEYIYITPDIFIHKKSDGECALNKTCFKSLEADDLQMVDTFLKAKEKEQTK